MKINFTFLFLFIVTLQSTAQGLVEYYQTGGMPSRKQQQQLQMRFGPYVAPQWYILTEGFARNDVARFDQSLNGLLTASPVTRIGWSVGAGVAFRNKWAVEAGLVQSPIHNEARINSRPPVSIVTRGERSSVFLRGKWAVLSTSRQWHRSGFWLTGGAWAVPHNVDKIEQHSVTGFTRRGADAIDQMALNTRTQANNSLTGLFELGLEYQVRVSGSIDLGVFARRNWGLGDALTTDVAYQINNQPVGQATLRAKGTGASYGFTMRYIFKRPTTNRQNLYQLQGNH